MGQLKRINMLRSSSLSRGMFQSLLERGHFVNQTQSFLESVSLGCRQPRESLASSSLTF